MLLTMSVKLKNESLMWPIVATGMNDMKTFLMKQIIHNK